METVEERFNKEFERLPSDIVNKYIVCCCAKNENEYIREWIQHHLDIGFDMCVIGDNNNDDSLLSVIEDYIEQGKVFVFDYRNFGCFQVEFYSLMTKKGKYKWCAYFDADEYLEIVYHKNVKDFLDSNNSDCICIHWMLYGPNDNVFKTNKPIQERFKDPLFPLTWSENMFIKSIVRGGDNNAFTDCWYRGSHLPISTVSQPIYSMGGYAVSTEQNWYNSFPIRYKYAYLKHYYTKSYQEWSETKTKRGWPDGTDNISTWKYLILQDSRIPLIRITESLFSEGYDKYGYSEVLNEYNVINVRCNDGNTYSLLKITASFMSIVTDHTFIISKELDDTLYNELLECAFRTGNRLVACDTDNECWNTYLKYNKGDAVSYYIIYAQ